MKILKFLGIQPKQTPQLQLGTKVGTRDGKMPSSVENKCLNHRLPVFEVENGDSKVFLDHTTGYKATVSHKEIKSNS